MGRRRRRRVNTGVPPAVPHTGRTQKKNATRQQTVSARPPVSTYATAVVPCPSSLSVRRLRVVGPQCLVPRGRCVRVRFYARRQFSRSVGLVFHFAFRRAARSPKEFAARAPVTRRLHGKPSPPRVPVSVRIILLLLLLLLLL